MLAFIVAPFLTALTAPYLCAKFPRASGWLLGLPSLAMTAYLLWLTPAVREGGFLALDWAWEPSLGVRFSIYVDALGLSFAWLICGIGTLILWYAGGYMGPDSGKGRFLTLMLLFQGAMLGTVLADDLFTLFVFWELTSITSYLLIGHEHHREQARSAALQALLVTGGGGLAMLAGFVLLTVVTGTSALHEMPAHAALVQESPLYLPILVLILLGAFTKSAQFPFHFWLPNAMQAPTPASAYLHSSTMVKAGLYLMARISPVLGGTEAWTVLLIAAGGLTVLAAGWLAYSQTVFKPLLAYTTLIALGLVTLCLGVGTTLAVQAAMLFLFVHAIYKGALFMVAGAVDHGTGTKDTERLGALWRKMPYTAVAAVAAGLSMAGLPPLVGFLGKEALYDVALHATTAMIFIIAVMFAGNVINVYVSLQVGYRPFFGREQETPRPPHEGGLAVWLGPLLLGCVGLALGLMPGALGGALITPAVVAVTGEAPAAALKLWHGFNLPLLMSASTLGAGLALYWLRHPLRTAARRLERWSVYGPEAAYDASVRGMLWSATWHTRIVQHGYLRYYLLTIVAFWACLPGYTLLMRHPVAFPEEVLRIRPHELGLAGLVSAAAIFATVAKSRLAAVMALGVVGYGTALIFVFFSAPDVAMTQFLVETFAVLLFVLVFHRLPPFTEYTSTLVRVRDLIFAALAGGLVTALALAAIHLSAPSTLAEYFAAHSVEQAHGRNVVNVILVDFRALDTLGEITVLCVSALGIFALLQQRRAAERGEDQQ